MRLSLFGDLRLTVDGNEIRVPRRQLRMLLAMLALADRRAVANEVLIENLWGAGLPAEADHSLHVYISRLRGIHPEVRQRLRTVEGGYALDAGPESIDILEFEHLVDRCRTEKQEAAMLARRALDRWIGQPLLGFQYEEWAQRHLRRLYRLRRDAVAIGAREAIGSLSDVGEWAAVLEDMVELNPLDGELWSLLVGAYRRTDRATAAADAEWRMKHALAHEDSGSRVEHHLEAPASPPLVKLVGRDEDLDDLIAAVEQSQLVSVVGPPGTGKTQLVLNAAMQVPLSPRYVFFGDHPTPIAALCAGLGLRLLPGAPSLETLARAASRRPGLIVLDNCEHVAADAARFVHLVMRNTESVRFLTSSRMALKVPGEHVVELRGLDVEPDVDEVLSDAAALLSVRLGARSREHEGPATLNQIARRLDGIPLVMELVAAAMSRLGASRIQERIDDPGFLVGIGSRGKEGYSVFSSVRHSLDSVDEDSLNVFQRVSWFSARFDIDDALAVVPEMPRRDLERSLDQLVGSSLLEARADGYRSLWAIAAVGRTLDPDRNRNDRCLHAKWVADRVEALAPTLRTARALGAHKKIEALSQDISDAFTYALDWDAEMAANLAANLKWHWHVRGNWAELAPLAEAVVDRSDNVHWTAKLGALEAKMILQFDLRQAGPAIATAIEGLRIAAEHESAADVVFCEALVAACHSTTGDNVAGVEAIERATRASTRVTSRWVKCVAWFAEASLYLNTTNHQKGVDLCRQVVEAPDCDPSLWSASAYVLARDLRNVGDLEEARVLIDQSLAILGDLGEPLFGPLAEVESSLIHLQAGHKLQALRDLCSAMRWVIELGDSMALVPCINAMALVVSAVGELDLSLKLVTAAEGRRLSAPWQVNPWDVPEVDDLATELQHQVPAERRMLALQRGYAMTDDEILEACESVLSST